MAPHKNIKYDIEIEYDEETENDGLNIKIDSNTCGLMRRFINWIISRFTGVKVK